MNNGMSMVQARACNPPARALWIDRAPTLTWAFQTSGSDSCLPRFWEPWSVAWLSGCLGAVSSSTFRRSTSLSTCFSAWKNNQFQHFFADEALLWRYAGSWTSHRDVGGHTWVPTCLCQRCWKFSRTSHTTGPSSRQCTSCHASLGPAWHTAAHINALSPSRECHNNYCASCHLHKTPMSERRLRPRHRCEGLP